MRNLIYRAIRFSGFLLTLIWSVGASTRINGSWQ